MKHAADSPSHHSERRAPLVEASHFRADVLAGLTTGVVALPLALAFGEASGAGPMAGLWGAIILGFVAAALGGTPDARLRSNRAHGRGVRAGSRQVVYFRTTRVPSK